MDALKPYLAALGGLRTACRKLATARGDVGAELALDTSEAESDLVDQVEALFADEFNFLQREIFE